MPTFLLQLVTPDRVLLSAPVRSVRAPGVEGSLGVLAGHAPLMTALTVGLIKVEHENGDVEQIATSGGFMEVTPGKAVLLTESAEEVSQIDIARAEESKKRAQERLAPAAGKEIDKSRAKAALERAVNRLKIAQKYKK